MEFKKESDCEHDIRNRVPLFTEGEKTRWFCDECGKEMTNASERN